MATAMSDHPVADELAIRNLIARLAFCADNPDVADLDDYLRCFTEDAVWDMAGQVATGHTQIYAGAKARRENATVRGRHFVSMTWVELADDTATAESYFQFVNSSVKPPVLAMVGHYQDRFARTAEGWKLAHRVITFG